MLGRSVPLVGGARSVREHPVVQLQVCLTNRHPIRSAQYGYQGEIPEISRLVPARLLALHLSRTEPSAQTYSASGVAPVL